MLSSSQLVSLKTFIDANPELSAIPNTTDGAFDVAAKMNELAVPNFFIWKESASITEIMGNGFDWTRIDNLTVGKARIWDFMTTLGFINPSQANVRSGILAAFSAGGDNVMRQAIFNHCQRLATVAEKLFATGTGAASNDQGVGPAQPSFYGLLSYQDVLTARNP